MSSSFDTLNIAPLRRGREIPMAEISAANHPEAAAVARERIAGIDESTRLVDAKTVPTLPTAQLETNRNRLADQVAATKPPSSVKIAGRAVSGRGIPSAIRPLLTAAGVFMLILILLKSPVIIGQLQYLFNKPQPSPLAQIAATSVVPADPTISIPKINVFSPVVYEPSVAEANVQKALESGVVHYGNTPMPGQLGNSVIFGHSSNDWWQPGNYKFIFGLLDKLVPGDRFSVDYQSHRYIYEVTSTQVVAPTDVSVLNPTAVPTMTLITCTPPGTSLKRLIVVAKQVDPLPTQRVAPVPVQTASKPASPGAPTGFFDKMGQAVTGIVNGMASLFSMGDNTAAPQSSGAATGSTLNQIPVSK
jgi:LPXTG-site transpeptidase (sortase) family protein